MGAVLVTVNADDDLVQERAQQLLTVSGSSGRRRPDPLEVGAEAEKGVPFLGFECPGPLPLAECKRCLGAVEFAEALLPFGFEAAGDQPVLGLDGAVATFRTRRLVLSTLVRQTPLGEVCLVILFEPLCGVQGSLEPCRLQGLEERRGNGGVDLDPADIKTIDTAAVDHVLTGAVVAGGGRAPAIVGMQPPTAMAAAGEPLKQSIAFPHGPPERCGVGWVLAASRAWLAS
jgi:hypothetical protein